MSDSPFHKPITGVQMINPTRDAVGGMSVVVLDRIEPGVTPEYCIHGKVTCHGCDVWCWLGSETYQLVSSGRIVPLCQPCATKMIPPDSKPVRNANDHRRADGPH